jgi:hypothetical protein
MHETLEGRYSYLTLVPGLLLGRPALSYLLLSSNEVSSTNKIWRYVLEDSHNLII